MASEAFRAQLVEKLNASDRILLRILRSSADGSAPAGYTGPELILESRKLAERLCSASPGQVVLLLLPHSPELFLLHLGLILIGRVPAVLAWPTARVDAQKYQRNLLHQLQNLPASQLITVASLAENLGPALAYPAAACPIPGGDIFSEKLRGVVENVPVRREGTAGACPNDALFLQFSGGTTGAQKCVVVTETMLAAQMAHLRAALNFAPEDGVASWLPLYHDMGLIACFWFPLWHGNPSIQFSASDWLLAPDLLFRMLEQHRATFAWLPNFAFSYLAGSKDRMTGTYSLAHVRALINCSEPVRRGSIDAFTSAFADWGIRPDQMQASYAMAENVFAVTQTKLGHPPVVFPRAHLAARTSPALPPELSFDVKESVFVSSGAPVEGCAVRIRSATPEIPADCSDGVPGDIEIRTDCQFSGYWGGEGYQRQALTEDGWYRTGDHGFLSNGQLFVIGRTKDIVIIGGQNIFPEDVETLVNSLPGIYTGRVVAFGLDDASQGTQTLAVVAELRGEFDPAKGKALEREIRATVLSGVGVAPRFVQVVPERWIVKSTAGKISRRETRERFLEEANRKSSPADATK